MLKRIVCGMLLACALFAVSQDKPKNVCKSTRLGPMAVAITCLNGADPTGRKYGDTLIISCGSEK